jgi:hypothetical protein
MEYQDRQGTYKIVTQLSFVNVISAFGYFKFIHLFFFCVVVVVCLFVCLFVLFCFYSTCK